MIVAILQARMGSSRLPGKVMMPIMGRPMLELQIERIIRAPLIDKLVVATTIESLDDKVEELCCSIDIDCFRGSEEDLLDRYYESAKQYNAEYIVRLTGDDPLSDPNLINDMIAKMKACKYDVVTNTLYPTYPEGLDLTVLTAETLNRAWREASLRSEREHVTPYIFNNPEEFDVFHYKQDIDRSNLRWTVDYEEDMYFVKEIYNSLYPFNSAFTTDDIYKLLESNPDLVFINSNFVRNAGLLESIKNDKKV
jgi:spore coat polysaccharide biosynthesis protein SpsF|tara:strand:- start:858 stop:1613 length:756 start_codon:yes stop_codon:yes gene_type:complete